MKEFLRRGWRRGGYYLELLNSLQIPRHAASLSFFTIVAIFPLATFVVNLMSYFVSYDIVAGEIFEFMDQFLPYQSPLVVSNLKTIFSNRGEFSFYGALFLFLAAGVLYLHMQHIIADMLGIPRIRNFFLARLFFLVWLLGMVLVLFAPLLLGFVTGVIASWGIRVPLLAAALSEAGVMIFGFLVFALIMLSLHLKKVRMRRLVLGGIYFSLAIQIGKQAYQWMTAQNLGRYNLIYGSFTSLMLGILWIYYFYGIFLFFIYWTTHKEVSGRG